jgi:hypothetical protein
MNGDVVGRVAYTEADSQRWAAAQVERDVISMLAAIRDGRIAPELLGELVAECGRELARVHKVRFGEVSPEVASALAAVA